MMGGLRCPRMVLRLVFESDFGSFGASTRRTMGSFKMHGRGIVTSEVERILGYICHWGPAEQCFERVFILVMYIFLLCWRV